MATTIRRKPTPRSRSAKVALSKAERVRINGAKDTIEPIPYRPVGTLPVTVRELALDALAGPDWAPESMR